MGRDEVVAVLLAEDIPPARVGEVLLAARRARGWKRSQVAAMARVSTKKLRAYELGRKRVPAETCTVLAECYGEDLLALVPERVPLEIDWQRVDAGPDDVLITFLDIVHKLRDAKPGEAVPLRAEDLTALAEALERDAATIERQIADLLGCSRAEARALHRAVLRRKVVLPVAGLAAGVVALTGTHAAVADAPVGGGKRPLTDAPVTVPVAETRPAIAFTDPPETATTVAPLPAPTLAFTDPAPAPAALAPPPSPPAPAPEPAVSAPAPPAPTVTPPSIPPDDTPVGILPGEHPLPPPTD
jgi:transcriptional regulator with XRE-family HTH domain